MGPWSHPPDDDPAAGALVIGLDTLSPAERRDLANSLLRAAWSAALVQTRILLLDLLRQVDGTIFEGLQVSDASLARNQVRRGRRGERVDE
jgi:hypothetical protein